MDNIFIEDLEVFAKHGVLAAEKELGQKFLVSAKLYLDTCVAGLTDELSGSINYAMVCQYINEFMNKNTYNLIETVAEYLARDILIRFSPMLQEITITIKKPWAPVGLPLKNVGVTISRKWHTAYISIGSNMGDKQAYLQGAVDEFKKHKMCRVIKQASVIETLPYGKTDQDNFLNSALEIKTLLSPVELLSLCNILESKAGRVRKEVWGPRTLDADIIFYDDIVMNNEEPELIIPHKDMHNREFVLKPMDEIAPQVMHPLYQKSVRVLYEELKSKASK